MKQLTCFDFDGTLIAGDSLFPFVRHTVGRRRLYLGLALWFVPLVLMKLRVLSNMRVKPLVLSWYWRGMSAAHFADCGRTFAPQIAATVRPGAVEALIDALQAGRVVVVSASMSAWVRPAILYLLGGAVPAGADLHFVGTEPEVRDGLLTGRFATPNCYGPEKVRRLQGLLPAPRPECHITAYGDSRGDRELLAYADEAHYQPFRGQ